MICIDWDTEITGNPVWRATRSAVSRAAGADLALAAVREVAVGVCVFTGVSSGGFAVGGTSVAGAAVAGAAVGLEPAGFVAVSAGFVGVGLAVAVSELFVGAGEDSLVGGAMVAVGEGMPASLPPWLTATAATTMIPAAAAPMTARTPHGGPPFGPWRSARKRQHDRREELVDAR